jgi:hypothetical protein
MSEQNRPRYATHEDLYDLWFQLRDSLVEGMAATPSPRASFLDVVRAFLRDNGISAQGMTKQDMAAAMQDLSLPFGPPPDSEH